MGALGQHPIPTRGHPSFAAALRAYDARWPGAPAQEVAWMLGVSVREVWVQRCQDEGRGPARPRVDRKTPAEVMRDVRARRRARGKCEECGEKKPAKKKLRGEGPARCCRGCLKFERERVAAHRAEAEERRSL